MLDVTAMLMELLNASLYDVITLSTLAFVACFLSLLGYALVPSAQERAVRHLPSPPRTLPFLDHTMAPFRYRERLYDFFLDESTKHKGKMWRYKAVGRAVAVVLTTPEAFGHVLKTKFEDFGKEHRMWRIMEDLLGNGIFAVNGPLWMHQRKTASHLFSLQMMRDSMEQSVVKSTTILCRRLAHCAANSEVVDVKRLLDLFTMDVFTKIGFGVDLKSLEASETHPSPPFVGAFDRASAQILSRFRTPVWVWQLKKWLNVGSECTMREDNKVLDALVYEVISRSMARRTIKGIPVVNKAPEDEQQLSVNTTDDRDLISLFLEKEATEYSKHGEKATADAKLIRDMAVSFLIAGRDTTSQSMAWFLIMLNRNPRAAHRIRTELAEKLPSLLDGSKLVPTMEDVHQLTYLEAAIRENLRLNPVVAITTREALRDTTLHDGTFIKQGTRISLPVYALSRLEQVWGEDALEFKPERWIDDETGKLIQVSPFKFSAFLGGPRVCIGMKFALMEMKITMAALLSKFDLKTVKDPFDFTYKPTVTMTVKGPVDVVVTPRVETIVTS